MLIVNFIFFVIYFGCIRKYSVVIFNNYLLFQFFTQNFNILLGRQEFKNSIIFIKSNQQNYVTKKVCLGRILTMLDRMLPDKITFMDQLFTLTTKITGSVTY